MLIVALDKIKVFFSTGSVKDSVVGEERIAQYLLAVLNIRGTPLHWKSCNSRRMEAIERESARNVEYSLKGLRPSRRKAPDNSSVLYIEVTDICLSICTCMNIC